LDRKDPYLRIQFVTIFVRDVDRSIRFFVDQLGFSVVMDARLPHGERRVAIAPPDGSTLLSLRAPEPGSKEHCRIGEGGPVVLFTEDVSVKFQEWSARGIRFQNPPQTLGAGGPTFVNFEDVDGNSFTLAGFDELTRALEARRREIAEKLESERRATQELEIAKQVQARLFPQMRPALRTLEYTGVCLQARQVGGDYYDFLDLGAGRLGLVIGDISGKGIGAALLMANLQANLRSQSAIAWEEPRRLLQSANRLFYENTADSAYASLFFAEYDDLTRRLRYASCGHLPGFLLRRDGSLELLDSTATVLGLFKQWDCSIEERVILPEDILALYTDGITESFNAAEEDFGEQRLIDALWRHRNLPSQGLLTSILDEVREFGRDEQHDDITLIVAKCHTAD
jgi:serine phosphatase RsbU (regulator of sigma subunit)/predicted enzyme related to lactoylglutathione lyase